MLKAPYQGRGVQVARSGQTRLLSIRSGNKIPRGRMIGTSAMLAKSPAPRNLPSVSSTLKRVTFGVRRTPKSALL